MMNFHRRVLNTDFNNWLNQNVYYEDSINVEKRKYVLYDFVKDLKTFLLGFGYSITYSEKDLMLCLARFIFKVQKLGNHSKLTLMENLDARPEDHDMFLHRIGTDEWNQFMKAYDKCDDFDLSDTKGRFITYSIPQFAWYNVNIQDSAATQFVDEILAGSDTEGDDQPRQYRNRKIVDPYLIDQQNNIGKYNRWD